MGRRALHYIMLYKVRDIEKFYKVKVTCYWGSYEVLFFYIPKIDQIQSVAGTMYTKEWGSRSDGHRTTLAKLPKRWAVPVEIKELNAAQVAELCPSVLDVEYSLHMLEDMKIRNEWKYSNHLKDMERHREWLLKQRWMNA